MKPSRDVAYNIFDLAPLSSFHRALPDFGYTPSGIEQCLSSEEIAFAIFRDFGPPKILPTLRPFKKGAIVPVPEAPMHKDRRSVPRQYDVRFTGQAPVVQDKSESKSV